MTVWTWIEQHQNLTVGILGFVGVIATLWINAWQVRRQRRKELCHERQTLRVALAEELRINRESFVNSMKSLEASRDQNSAEATGLDFLVPTDEIEDAYRSFIGRIGLLSQTEVRKVMNAYIRLRTYNATLLLMARLPQPGDRYARVPFQGVPMLTEMQKSLIGPLDEAMDALERARHGGCVENKHPSK